MSLLFNMLPRFVIAFLPRSKRLLISWLQSPSTVIFRAQENKICHCFHFCPSYLLWSDGTRCHDLSFFNIEFQASFSLSSFTFIKKHFSSSSFSATGVVSSAYLGLLIFLQQSWFQLVFHLATFHMMCSVYKLNKQGDDIQPWGTPFPILNQSIVPYLVLYVVYWPHIQVSQEAGKVVWYSYLF